MVTFGLEVGTQPIGKVHTGSKQTKIKVVNLNRRENLECCKL